MKNQIVLGCGEVGLAVHKTLSKHYKNIFAFDTIRPERADKLNFINIKAEHKIDIIHVCFPYIKDFVKIIQLYQKVFRANMVIVHSSVPIGTTKKLGACAVHSPVIGNHPHLHEGIQTFVKFFGGNNRPIAKRAMALFSKCGVKGKVCSSEESEALKLLLNINYGLNIAFEKDVHKLCEKKKLNFDIVYKMAIQNYNTGYSKLKMPDVQRSIFNHIPGKIGGHCVIENCQIIGNDLKDIAEFIIRKNRTY